MFKALVSPQRGENRIQELEMMDGAQQRLHRVCFQEMGGASVVHNGVDLGGAPVS